MTAPSRSLFNLFFFYHITLITFISATFKTPWSSEHIYPLCDRYQDKEGIWIRTNNITSIEEEIHINKHFFLQPPGEALEFSQIWLPTSCSYHRFTNTSFYQMIDNLLQNHKYHHLFPNKQIHIALLGDSATRSIFCGLTRILSGSEMYGPCDNIVCGGSTGLPVTYKSANQIYEVKFSSNFKVTYSYIYGIDEQHHNGGAVIESVLNNNPGNRPYAVVINSGAWDFDELSRSNGHNPDNSGCDSSEANKISRERSSNKILEKMKYYSDLATKHHIRLIYRNNHYNTRFGPVCADKLLEERMKIIPQSIWEVWDNRGISKDVWKEQCYDGFHFDRHRVHTYDHHQRHMGYFKSKGWDLPGQLEIQLAQSLLNGIFYDYLADEFHRVYGVRPEDSEEKKLIQEEDLKRKEKEREEKKKKKEAAQLPSKNATTANPDQKVKIPLGLQIVENDDEDEEEHEEKEEKEEKRRKKSSKRVRKM